MDYFKIDMDYFKIDIRRDSDNAVITINSTDKFFEKKIADFCNGSD